MPPPNYAFWLRPLEISWKPCEAIGKEDTRFGSMINGESVLPGVMAIATMWKSSTIIRKGAVKMSKSETLVPPVHPGEILREDFMKPLGLTVNRLALELHVPATRIGEIVHERRRITAETALRLARYFNTNAEFWLNLQNFYDLEVSKRSGKTSAIERQVHPAAAVPAAV
jgi:antitoxin HigA-1